MRWSRSDGRQEEVVPKSVYSDETFVHKLMSEVFLLAKPDIDRLTFTSTIHFQSPFAQNNSNDDGGDAGAAKDQEHEFLMWNLTLNVSC